MRNIVPLILALTLLACSTAAPSPTPTAAPPAPTRTPTPVPTATPVPDPPAIPVDLSNVGILTPTVPLSEQTVFGYTYQRADGNRYVEGTGSPAFLAPVDIPLDGVPAWVAAAPLDGGGSIWAAVLEDGRVQAFLILTSIVTPIAIQPARLPPGMPPMLVVHRGVPMLLTAPPGDASPLTHPVAIGDDPANYAYVASNGDLVINLRGAATRLEVGAIPDARILQDERGRLLLVTGATTRYAHGILGDTVEGSSLTLVETDPPGVSRVIPMGGRVIEGIAPLWVDLDFDGLREIIVTLSDENKGAQLLVFGEDGGVQAEGPAIGRGFLWRHQLAAFPADLEPNLVVADNLTPHSDGVLEFYRWDEVGFNVFTSAAGYSTHTLGSRNLDRTLAADVNGDALVDLLAPTQAGDGLGAFTVQSGTVFVAWTVGFGATLTTNIGAVRLTTGELWLGMGLSNGVLRLWGP
jgi:hypothetical protein